MSLPSSHPETTALASAAAGKARGPLVEPTPTAKQLLAEQAAGRRSSSSPEPARTPPAATAAVDAAPWVLSQLC